MEQRDRWIGSCSCRIAKSCSANSEYFVVVTTSTARDTHRRERIGGMDEDEAAGSSQQPAGREALWGMIRGILNIPDLKSSSCSFLLPSSDLLTFNLHKNPISGSRTQSLKRCQVIADGIRIAE